MICGFPSEICDIDYLSYRATQDPDQANRFTKAPTDNAKRLHKGHDSRGAWGSPKRLYKAPTDYTKPQQTIQRPKVLDKTLQY